MVLIGLLCNIFSEWFGNLLLEFLGAPDERIIWVAETGKKVS